jgi:hypothetical protein
MGTALQLAHLVPWGSPEANCSKTMIFLDCGWKLTMIYDF